MADSGISEAPPERAETPPPDRTSGKTSAQLPIKELNGFELISKIGQGGMGTVFKGRQKSLDRLVALKILPPSIAKNKRFIERFQREARASAKLWHPHIVQGIDVGKDEASGLWYFAMEYVDGPSLKALLKQEKVLPEKRALEIVSQVALALQCVADSEMVHRDIKPDNILINQAGLAKLADLGLAKEITDSAELTQSGQALGTPNYMAPEQVRGEDNIDIRADLYALGATLFHLVTGQPPFKGGTSAEILSKHLVEPAPLAHKLNPQVSDGCSKLICKLMEKKPDDRVQTPKELSERIAVLIDPESGKTGQRVAIGGRPGSGMRTAVGARKSGQRPAVGNRISGDVERRSTALQMPVAPGSTGPLIAVDRKPTTGPRAPIHVRTTGNLDPVEREVRVIDLNPPRPARKSGGMLWVGIGAFAVIVLVVVIFVAMQNSDKPDTPKTTAAQTQKEVERPVQPQPSQPAQPSQPIARTEPRQNKAKASWDAFIALQAARPDDFAALLPAINEACELNRDTPLNAKAGEALLTTETRWNEAFSAALKMASGQANAAQVKGDFAAALDALKDDAIPANLRAKDWAQQLEGKRKEIRDAAETVAAKLLEESRGLAQGGDAARLQNAIDKSKAAETIPAALAPSAAKLAEERTAWAAALAALKQKEEEAKKATLDQAKELASGVRKDLLPIIQQNRFSAAADLLEKKLHDPALATAADILQQDKSDLTTVIALRQRAIDALRSMSGKSVTLKKGKGTLSGTVSAQQTLPGITLTLGDGPEITVAPDQLDPHDIDAFAPQQEGVEKGEDLRRRGLLWLELGDTHKARDFFKAARDAGKGDEMAAYFERADIMEMGEAEVRARNDFVEAETLFAAKKWKEAQMAYLNFSVTHAKTKYLASVAAQLKDRSDTIEHILNPTAPGLAGAYYRGNTFAGTPLLTRIDDKIDFDWNKRGPSAETGHDNYCVRWEGLVKITKPGHYTFATVSDDGARLWINGKQIIDFWRIQTAARHSGDIDLTEGEAEIKLEYYQAGGPASCRLYWALRKEFKEQIIPADALLHVTKSGEKEKPEKPEKK
jgi:serine/threonine-protein kinase